MASAPACTSLGMVLMAPCMMREQLENSEMIMTPSRIVAYSRGSSPARARRERGRRRKRAGEQWARGGGSALRDGSYSTPWHRTAKPLRLPRKLSRRRAWRWKLHGPQELERHVSIITSAIM